jgi:hypothetical protein
MISGLCRAGKVSEHLEVAGSGIGYRTFSSGQLYFPGILRLYLDPTEYPGETPALQCQSSVRERSVFFLQIGRWVRDFEVLSDVAGLALREKSPGGPFERAVVFCPTICMCRRSDFGVWRAITLYKSTLTWDQRSDDLYFLRST